MQIRNFSTGEIISENAAIMKGLEKAVGLRFRAKPKTLVFEFKKPQKPLIDMFFVRFPIDIICLDNNKKVIELKESLMPFKTFKPKQEVSCIIELPQGIIKSSRTKPGNKIVF